MTPLWGWLHEIGAPPMAQHKVTERTRSLCILQNYLSCYTLTARHVGTTSPPTMLFLRPHILTLLWVFIHLSSSAPANTTSSIGTAPTDHPTKSLLQSISPVHLKDDLCPTPPTQFLPYPPPPGYVPGPGCPPAGSGTQPSEFNPPPGVYGGSGSGSGSFAQTSSPGIGLRQWNPVARIFGGVLPRRKVVGSVRARIGSGKGVDAWCASLCEMMRLGWMFRGVWS
jgi:hypothetical protein